MLRRTKIIATIGPACRQLETLEALIQAGADVLRVNFSHASPETIELVKQARVYAHKIGKPLGIMADLQGPKIRIGRIEHGEIALHNGQNITLQANAPDAIGQHGIIPVTYENLPYELKAGDRVLLDDGLIELEVLEVQPPLVHCLVIEGGILRDNKGLNRKGGGLAAQALTDKDLEDLKTAVALEVDYIAISFVKDAADIEYAREKLKQLNAPHIPLIAKIERSEAMINLNAIIHATDALMVARGDLAVEVGAAEVPGFQKRIIEETRRQHKIVITATQMMESMVTQPQPTRAEVSDVANAILDGTDAVMLSAETARGLYPVKVVSMVDKICQSAEKHTHHRFNINDNGCHFHRPDEAISLATMHAANHFPVKAIIALTESGASALWMSRHHSQTPIYAITANPRSVNRLSLVQNVFPILFDFHHLEQDEINNAVIQHLKTLGHLSEGGYVLLTRGPQIGTPGGTNRLEVLGV